MNPIFEVFREFTFGVLPSLILLERRSHDIIYLDIEDTYGSLSRVNEALGIFSEPRRKPYSPHITVAHLKPGSSKRFEGLPIGNLLPSYISSDVRFSDRSIQLKARPASPVFHVPDQEVKKETQWSRLMGKSKFPTHGET